MNLKFHLWWMLVPALLPSCCSGQELPWRYKQCGHTKCVQEATCDMEANKCSCPARTIGLGRVQCAVPGNNCVCTFHGDPHVINFQGQGFKLLIPCSHLIADVFVYRTLQEQMELRDLPQFYPQRCWVTINGLARFPHSGPEDYAVSYESAIHINIRLAHGPARYTFSTKVDRNGFTVTKDTDMVSRGKDAAQFYYVVHKQCNVTIKFRPTDGSFYLEMTYRVSIVNYNIFPDRPSSLKKGLCGNCDTRTHSHSDISISPDAELQLTLHSIKIFDRTLLSDTNRICNNLQDTLLACPDEGADRRARNICGEMVINAQTRKCLTQEFGKDEALSKFTDCYGAACAGNYSCSYFQPLFGDCGWRSLDDYRNETGLCQ